MWDTIDLFPELLLPPPPFGFTPLGQRTTDVPPLFLLVVCYKEVQQLDTGADRKAVQLVKLFGK